MSAPWHLTAAEMDAEWDALRQQLAEAERVIAAISAWDIAEEKSETPWSDRQALCRAAMDLVRSYRPAASASERPKGGPTRLTGIARTFAECEGESAPAIKPAILAGSDSAPAAAEPWDKSKCTCVYATSKNTASVRHGYEMGGYVKEQCDYCKANASDQPNERVK